MEEMCMNIASFTGSLNPTGQRIVRCLLAAFLVLAIPICTTASPAYKITNLQTLGGTYARANAINDSGQIVGTSKRSNGAFSAFLYSNGGIQDLGGLGDYSGYNHYSEANAIHNLGQVVGSSYQASAGTHAFLWSNGTMTDVGAGTIDSCATGINDAGQIVGYGIYNGQTMAFEMEIVPEPGSVSLLLLGATGAASLLRRRRQDPVERR